MNTVLFAQYIPIYGKNTEILTLLNFVNTNLKVNSFG